MVILTLVTTLAAGMVWHQWRATEVEGAERARLQSAWILSGALDWARLILREDARGTSGVDHLGEPWAVPLAEARLSTFLAADRNSTVQDDGIEAFLSGSIEDAQARYNLRQIFNENELVPEQVVVLQRLCERAGLPTDLAVRLAQALRDAWSTTAGDAKPVAPRNIDQLAWLGVEPQAIERLRPWVTLLPVPTPVNVNTAPAEVLAAMVEGLALSEAQALARRLAVEPVGSREAFQALLRPNLRPNLEGIAASSQFFVVQGRAKVGDADLRMEALLQRTGTGLPVIVWQRSA